MIRSDLNSKLIYQSRNLEMMLVEMEVSGMMERVRVHDERRLV